MVAGRGLETYDLEPFSSYVKLTAHGNPDLFRLLVKTKILSAPCKECLFTAQGRELVDNEEMNHIGEP